MADDLPEESDGVAQMTELMREDRVAAPTPEVDPAARRRRRRRGWMVTAIVAAVAFTTLGGYIGWALAAPLARPAAEVDAPQPAPGEAAQIRLPTDGASAIEISGGEAYFQSGVSELSLSAGGSGARPMASISKVITAMVVLEARPLASADDDGPTITFTAADHALYDKYYVLNATISTMPTGSTMSEHDALEMMLIASASNYAEAVSTWAYGSQGAFVQAAQAWLAEHGLTHTTIVEPTGIDARNVSTPSDLIALGKLAMADPVIAQIVGMPEVESPDHHASNTNRLLGVDGVQGVKTGTLHGAGANLLYSARLAVGASAPLEITGVLLGANNQQSVDTQVTLLLDSIHDGFHQVSLGKAGDVFGTYSTAWGDEARITLLADAAALTWSDTSIEVSVEMWDVNTVREGDVVGMVTWTAGPEMVSGELVVDADIHQPDVWWRITHPGELG
ncbi:D-alanyl-D-alanine carboxypeptidase family protein [Homoserinibacter sp. GY 40078]|uniref:D-alanyl-D-alanine carboxypeptidase family protein n=1 Tax=Homoserinibacter sp. GY 40078 TaxID=2603275 RepID=UPI0011C9C98C|nr:D-alanyl-D-alanine carboxypeptidase [Homoserinibacter sp. GY 40078]TXK19091.1 D-alanyl-D-alanine carboxypeptidase [Homoserinibacter sp. GY 40078]